MAGIATAIGAAAVVGAGVSLYSSSEASSAQQSAANTASNTQMSMFNTIQGNESPWMQTGQQANSALSQFYGLPGQGGTGGASASTPNYNQILSNLPGYQFQLQQGTQAVDRNMASQGLFNSGAGAKALTQYGQGLAQNYAGQYTAGLQGLSQQGQAAASGVASAGMNAANQTEGALAYGGNAAASGYGAQSNAFNSGLQGLVGAYNYNGVQQNANQFVNQGAPSGGYSALNSSFYNPGQQQPIGQYGSYINPGLN